MKELHTRLFRRIQVQQIKRNNIILKHHEHNITFKIFLKLSMKPFKRYNPIHFKDLSRSYGGVFFIQKFAQRFRFTIPIPLSVIGFLKTVNFYSNACVYMFKHFSPANTCNRIFNFLYNYCSFFWFTSAFECQIKIKVPVSVTL